MSEERRQAGQEAGTQVKVVDRRRFGPEGEPLESPEGTAPRPPEAPRDDELAAQSARIEELTRALAAMVEDNRAFRQRLEREKERVLQAERAEVAQALLEATDDLERALAAVSGEVTADLRSLVEGVRLSLDVLQRRIAAMGAQRIHVVGQPFDPKVAEAVDTVPISDVALDGRVLQEIRSGYRIGERVLRPARVRVGRLARA